MKVRFWIIILTAIAVSVLAVFAYDSVNLDRLCAEQGGDRNGDVCLVQTIPEANERVPDQAESVNFDDIFTMKPNSVEFFYYPNPEKDKDTYRLFMLIRLPVWMGGGANDTSAFRAYSAKALDDACTIKYWPGPERQRIENPCQGSMYRVIDGATTFGAIHRTSAINALPYLDLSMDEDGMLYVEPPKWILSENGVVGHGRDISLDEIRTNSQFLVNSFAEYYPEYPPIPTRFAGYLLAEIAPDIHSTAVRYLDFPNKIGTIKMTVGKEPKGSLYPKLVKSNSELWQIGDTVIRIKSPAFDKNNDISESKKTMIEFSKEFSYRIEGFNLEFMKKEIVTNFFPEYAYDDLFLVSGTGK